MSEMSKLTSRFFLYLITISASLLTLSFLSLIQFSNTSVGPSSIFKMIIANTTSIYLKPNAKTRTIKSPFVPSRPQSNDNRFTGRDGQPTCVDSDIGACEKRGKRFCDPNRALLRVYMYDLPPEFHFGLLGWNGQGNQIWPSVDDLKQIPAYPGGLNLQHSMEYWLTLDLLASNRKDVITSCSAVRVENSSQADIIFVPFFSSVSYNRYSKLRGKGSVSLNKMLQSRLVQFLLHQNEWKRKGGNDHLIVAHHPNSMLDSRKKLASAQFLLADFGRYPVEVANLDKDIIAPYKHVMKTLQNGESAPFNRRSILAYFQGAIFRKDGGAIRQELYYLLKDEKDVHFTFGNIQGNGVRKAGQGMGSSKFCLSIAGDTPSSNRLFDAIVSHCVPVIISDKIELPFEDVLDYSEFCLFVRASDAVKPGYVLNLLRGIDEVKWTKMWGRLKEIAPHYEYHYPSRPGDAVDMIWQAVSRKISSAQSKINRKKRHFAQSRAIQIPG